MGGMYSRCCLLSLLGRCSRKKPCCSFLLFCGACFRVLLFSAMEKLKLKCKGLFNNRGCLGCCTKPPVIISMDDPSKGLGTRRQTTMTDNGSEEFWNSSTLGMDHSHWNSSTLGMDHSHSAAQSQRSISSIDISNHSNTDPPEFVNHGLLLWNQTRQQWIGNRQSESETQVGEPRISYNATYESLLGTKKPFPQPIPLREMVDFLVDIWEQDGLYD